MPKATRLVLVANDVGGVGGMEKHLEEMINRLKRVYPVTVVSRTLRLADPSGVKFIRIPAVRRPFPLMIAMFSIYASMWLMLLRRNSIIHTTGAIVWCKADVSTIHFCHAGWQSAVRGDGRGHRSTLHKLNNIVGIALKRSMERYCYQTKRTRCVVAVSKRIQRELSKFYSRPNETIKIIPNGVDIERFRPGTDEEKLQLRTNKGLPAKGTYLIFMGGDWERKGVRYLIDAFNQLAKRHPYLHVLVVGNGDAEEFGSFVVDEFKHRVHFVGRQNDAEVWYRMSDVFVFPTNYEACSLAVLEAAASGLAMLVTNVGGADEVVTEGVSGFFIERSTSSIVKKLHLLLKNPCLIREVASESRKRVENMTWDHTYRQFVQLYDHIASEKRNRRRDWDMSLSNLVDKGGTD